MHLFQGQQYKAPQRQLASTVGTSTPTHTHSPSLLPFVQELSCCVCGLEAHHAPPGALAAVRAVLCSAVSGGVSQLVVHLQSVAPLLVSREGWQLSLTNSGDLPVTLLPEQLQVRERGGGEGSETEGRGDGS